MIGFRSGLSTQDAFLLLKEEVLSNIPRGGEHLIMALDLKSAFDNVSQEAILSELSNLNCGERTFQYVKTFLSNRTATIGMGDTRSNPQDMPNKGTPQGSIISPLLFNVAMIGVARALQQIPNIGYTLYADDITIWTNSGSLAEKEYTLQAAAICVETEAIRCGLHCSPDKSEVIRIQGHHYKSPGNLNILLHGVPIREVPLIRILGLWLQSDGKANHTLQLLKTTTQQISKMNHRVVRNRKGMREEDTILLVQALVISRLSYGLPYLTLLRADFNKANAMIRVAYKNAISLPPYTSNVNLEALGLHNTFEEIQEAVLLSQRERLLSTATGLHILKRIGYPADLDAIQSTTNIPTSYRARRLRPQVPDDPYPIVPDTVLAEAKAARRAALRNILPENPTPLPGKFTRAEATRLRRIVTETAVKPAHRAMMRLQTCFLLVGFITPRTASLRLVLLSSRDATGPTTWRDCSADVQLKSPKPPATEGFGA
ncbi:uncharacterized protein LOC119435734 [Dermacentor silvarum]|uniref:uncharacterized protein LOC119435734 n=1 Tax=Dermacentor silvarum TaxID=543639 RepID=UPI00189C3F29|nr:uncharacterized protein LOC119435734 [Dermacentor silvarum]